MAVGLSVRELHYVCSGDARRSLQNELLLTQQYRSITHALENRSKEFSE